MKKRVEELAYPQLDYYVAQIENIFYLRGEDGRLYQIDDDGRVYASTKPDRSFYYAPSLDWRQGGAIVEKLGVSINKMGEDTWIADINRAVFAVAHTPLVAAMRVVVMQRYGPAVETETD
ncbi:MAG: DUF2591 family protein [Betaproteobacteria bacterium]|nr:DUF2591 family protein [Betaproteobacteria bacterium]MBI3937947.1 DUF2591 family protein [Betaproteobacteria bacterium]